MRTSHFIAIFIGLFIDQVTHAQRSIWDDPLEEETASMPPPTFQKTSTIVTVREGQMAKLECSLENLGTKKIIWRRKSDLNPLTIGRRTYVDDARIMVDHKPLTPEWPLMIKQVRKDDGGDYECQVSSKDRLLRRYVQLIVRPEKKKKNRNKKKDRSKVTDSKLSDWNPSDLLPPNFSSSRGINITGRTYVEKNHKLRLVCNATSLDDDDPLHGLDWFFNGQKLTTDVKNKITIHKKVSLTDKTIHSILEIASAEMENAGVYICRTSVFQITSARVDVLNAGTVNVKRGTEKDGKMASGRESSQHGPADGGNNSPPHHMYSYVTLFICLLLSFMASGRHNLLTSQTILWSPT